MIATVPDPPTELKRPALGSPYSVPLSAQSLCPRGPTEYSYFKYLGVAQGL